MTIILCLIGAELYLRNTEIFATYTEKSGWGYFSEYEPRSSHQPPNSSMISSAPEYSYQRSYNSDGFRDDEHEVTKKRFRVILLGDSFIDGVGAPIESTPPKILQKALSKLNIDVDVISGGCIGGDPVTHLHNINKFFLRYSPDLVIITMNASDLDDIITQGGINRYRHPTKFMPRTAFLWQHSHLFRGIMQRFFYYNWIQQSPKAAHKSYQNAVKTIQSALSKIKTIGSTKNFTVLSFIYPYPATLFQNSPRFEILKQVINKHPDVHNLQENLRQRFGSPENAKKFYYAIDNHFKPDGYKILISALLDQVSKTVLKIKKKTPSVYSHNISP